VTKHINRIKYKAKRKEKKRSLTNPDTPIPRIKKTYKIGNSLYSRKI